MENERSAEEKKEIVIPCEHLPWDDDWKFAKRVVVFHVRYVEFERVIDCQSKSASCTPYRERRPSTDFCYIGQEDACNPVDCQECKAKIIHYLTNVISHPDPNRVMTDLCTRFYDYLCNGTPNSEIIPYCCWSRVANEDLKPEWSLTNLRYTRTKATRRCLFKLFYLCDDTCLNTDTNIAKEYPVVEDVSYQIRNNIERHCLSQLGNDKREWYVSWVGIQTPRPHHPQLCHLNLTKVDQDVMDFECPICFQGQVEKLEYCMTQAGEKRKRVDSPSINKKKRSRLEHEVENIVTLPCQHMYHESCISQWLQVACRDTCPTCRYKLLNIPVCNAWKTHEISGLGDFSVFKHIHKPTPIPKTKLVRFWLSKAIKHN